MIPTSLGHAYSPEELVRGFYQHGAGNCTAIASIKAALDCFGTEPIFQASQSGDSCQVVLRDGFTLTIREEELQLATRRSGFRGDDELLLRHAHLAFAVMAKRLQSESRSADGEPTFGEAIDDLNDGYLWKEGLLLLGLGKLIIFGPDRKLPMRGKIEEWLSGHSAAIVQSARHTWYGADRVHDDYGSVSPRPRRSASGVLRLSKG